MSSFAAVLSMNASKRPLAQVLHLWDVMFAYGVHLSVLFCVAQLILSRADILAADSPIQMKRCIEERDANLVAKDVIRVALQVRERERERERASERESDDSYSVYACQCTHASLA